MMNQSPLQSYTGEQVTCTQAGYLNKNKTQNKSNLIKKNKIPWKHFHFHCNLQFTLGRMLKQLTEEKQIQNIRCTISIRKKTLSNQTKIYMKNNQ